MDPITIAAIMSSLGVVGGIAGKLAHNKYAKDISGLNMTMPAGITEAQGVLKGLSTQGLPGIDTLTDNVDQKQSSSIYKARQVAANPSELLSFIAQTDAQTKAEMRNLGVQDQQAKLENKLRYANFLSGVLAPAQQRMQEFDINKKMGIAKERLLGTGELINGITNGANQGINMGIQSQYLNQLGDNGTNKGMDPSFLSSIVRSLGLKIN